VATTRTTSLRRSSGSRGSRRGCSGSVHIAGEIDRKLAVFIRGQGAVCLSLAVYYSAALGLIGAAVGFSLITHAVIVQWWPYIVGTVLWTPFSFIKFWKVKGRWQGNRSLMRAFEEELGHDEGADDAD